MSDNQTVIANAALQLKNLFVNITEYPIVGQGTINGVQYSDPEISTLGAGANAVLFLYKSETNYPNTVGHLIRVHYDISFELKAANTTADLTWKLEARNKDGSWVRMCADQPATDIGTDYVAKTIKGYLDIDAGVTKIPFELRLVFQSNEGTAKIVDEWAQTDAVNFANTTAITALYKLGTKLMAGLQISVYGDKCCPYYDLTTNEWVDTGQVKSSHNTQHVRCFAKFGDKLFLGNEWEIAYTTTGESWSQVYNQPDNIYSFAAFGDSPAKLYAAQGNGQVFAAENPHQESSWAKTKEDPTGASCCYALIVFDSKLWVGTNGEVFYSGDGGATAWTKVITGLSGTHVYCFAIFGTKLYAGTGPDGKIFKLNDAGNAWELAVDLPDGTTKIRSLVQLGLYLYAGTEPNGDIYYSSDGSTWTLAKNLTGATVIYGMVQTNDKVFVGANGNKLWYSDLVSGEGTGRVKNDTKIEIVGRIV